MTLTRVMLREEYGAIQLNNVAELKIGRETSFSCAPIRTSSMTGLIMSGKLLYMFIKWRMQLRPSMCLDGEQFSELRLNTTSLHKECERGNRLSSLALARLPVDDFALLRSTRWRVSPLMRCRGQDSDELPSRHNVVGNQC